ncbi:MAG: polysaccharide deacetylase family protein [Actinomycetota bacterium]
MAMSQGWLGVITYHYVRNPGDTLFPLIPAVDEVTFAQHLDHLAAVGDLITPDELAALLTGELEFDRVRFLLTFDDGLIDHHRAAAPMLEDAGTRGLFFASNATLGSQERLLDVHKLQHILGTTDDRTDLAARVLALVEHHRADHPDVPPQHELRARYHEPSRFDTADTMLVKRLLQGGLPDLLRHRLLDELFEAFVPVDEPTLAAELYCNRAELREMIEAGHGVGGHGATHVRVSDLDDASLAVEIEQSATMVRSLVGTSAPWSFCYPYGDYDDRSHRLLADLGCGAAYTTKPGQWSAGSDVLRIPRFDANDVLTLTA